MDGNECEWTAIPSIRAIPDHSNHDNDLEWPGMSE
jgi:hypothetical protein